MGLLDWFFKRDAAVPAQYLEIFNGMMVDETLSSATAKFVQEPTEVRFLISTDSWLPRQSRRQMAQMISC